jgi:hypothetical protein
MSEDLTPDEIGVLMVLAEASPERLHLHQLAPRTSLGDDRPRLLRVVDGLIVRRLIECTPLRGSEGLDDAANILISDQGAKLLDSINGHRAEASITESNRTVRPVTATILNVLISCPSDVTAESESVMNAIQEWNANNHAQTGIMLHPVHWRTHSYPEAGDRPQGLINKQIVDSGHLLIGIFATV